MNTFRSFRCDVVSALEERIWLDRREQGKLRPQGIASGPARLLQWLRDLRARTQLGPLDEDGGWSGGDPDKRF